MQVIHHTLPLDSSGSRNPQPCPN